MATQTETHLRLLHELIDSKAERGPGSQRPEPGHSSRAYNIRYAQFDRDSTDDITRKIEQLQKIVQNMLPIDYSINLIIFYDQKLGILEFIKKTMLCRELDVAVNLSLALVKLILEKLKSEILLRQLAETRELMLEIGTNLGTSSKEKENALENLICIIEMKRMINTGEVKSTLDVLRTFALTFQSPPQRVFRRVYELVGLICKNYKADSEDHVTSMENMILHCLEAQVSAPVAKTKSTMAEGCIRGIMHIMSAHSYNSNSRQDSRERIYKILKHYLGPNFIFSEDDNEETSGTKKYSDTYKGPQRAGLALFAQHGAQLSSLIFGDYKFWHVTLQQWVASENSALHQIGYQGLSSFYFTMGKFLEKKCGSIYKEASNYFVNYFKTTITSLESTNATYRISLAIQGFGDFSGSCSPKEVNEMFSNTLQRAELFLKCTQEDDRSLAYLPQYVQALGCIVCHITILGPQCQATLQCLAVLMFERCPTLPIYAHQGCIEAMLVTFSNLLATKANVAESFINQIVYQAIIRTCSHTIASDAEIMKDSLSPFGSYMLLTYDRYLPQWEGLLNIHQDTKLKSVTLEQRALVAKKVLSAFVHALIRLVEKLDLSTKEKNQQSDNQMEEEESVEASIEIVGMDPETCLEACKPKDFKVFINLVDLAYDLLPEVEPALLLPMMDELIETLITQAINQPLISGFNKLLALCLNISEEAGYYSELDVGADGNKKYQCYLLLGRFLRDVVNGISQFKGDLLLSSIRLLLAAPVKMVPDLLQYLVAPFKMTLKLGLSYVPIATELVATLFKWQRQLPRGTLVPLLVEIVPLFDDFLHSKDKSNAADATSELAGLQSRKNSRVKFSRKCSMAEAGEKDSDLASLQRQILLFLAQLDFSTCQSVIKVEDSQIADEAISWTSRKLLKLDLPFTDLKPSIYLDDFLPLVCKIALTSSDRHTRVTACELLHSSVLHILGTAKQVNERLAEHKEMLKLVERVYPVIISLGCDSDALVRQLFHPLVLQIIHYQTNKERIDSKETLVLMNTIMDGLTQPENVALRDFSAVCLKEFVVWTLKQISGRLACTSQVSLEAVMQKIFLFSKHPCQFKRLGAALAVNNLYAVVREHKSMDDCWLELLYYMVNSLMLTDADEQLVGTIQQTARALTHIERVLRVKSGIFNKPSETRTTPPEFEGNLLKHAVVWLLKNCSSRVEACRSVCQELVMSLAKWAVKDSLNSPQAIVEILRLSNSDVYLKVCECAGEHAVTEELSEDQLLEKRWLNILIGSLDCYAWILNNGIVSAAALFPVHSHPKIFRALSQFYNTLLTNIDTMDIDQNALLTVREAEKLEAQKCQAIVSALKFINTLLVTEIEGLESACVHPRMAKLFRPMFGDCLWKVIALLVLEPASVGFTLRNKLLLEDLQPVLRSCLELLPTKLPVATREEFLQSFNVSLNEHQERILQIRSLEADHINDAADTKLIACVQGLQLLRDSQLWVLLDQDQLGNFSGEELMKRVFGCMYFTNDEDESSTICTISPLAKNLMENMLKFSFSFKVSKTALYMELLNSTPVDDVSDGTTKSIGDLLTTEFKVVITEFLLKNPLDSLKALVEPELEVIDNMDVPVDLMDKVQALFITRLLLGEVHRSPELKLKFGAEVSEELMKFFDAFTSLDKPFLEVVEILAYTADMLKEDSESCKYIVEWVSSNLRASDLDLTLKRRCLDLAVPILKWNEDHQVELISALRIMKEQSFPLFPSQMLPQSSMMVSYKAIFTRLLEVMNRTQSDALLHFIASISTCDANHVCKAEIQQSLAYLMKTFPKEKKLSALEHLFTTFKDHREVPEKIGYVDQYLLPILQSCDQEVCASFFAQQIPALLEILEDKFNPSNNLMAFKRQMAAKSGCFKLFEVMYGRFSRDELKNDSGIGEHVKNSLNKKLMGMTKNARLEKIDAGNEAALYRDCQRSALNALCSIVCCLFPDLQEPRAETMYAEFLFSCRSAHWPMIIDCSQKIKLKMDFDEIPKRRGVLVNLRRDARDHRGTMRAVGTGRTSLRSQTVQYIASQQLFDSSLSEDVTRFDLSNIDVLSMGSGSQLSLAAEEETQVQVEIYLEMDSLNQHACMPILCAVVKRLGSQIKPVANQLPSWMQNLLSTLRSTAVHDNIKIFITKLIINTEDVFRPYASAWLEPLCSVVSQKMLGSTINYLITDTVALLLSWHNVAVPLRERPLQVMEASKLLLFMMEQCCYPRRDYMKFALDLVKTMVEVWKPGLDVNFQFFCDRLWGQGNEMQMRQAALQLTAILLLNKRTPWNEFSKTDFVDSLVENYFMSTEKKIFHIAAENLGLILKWAFGPVEELGEITSLDKDDLFTRVVKKLDVMKMEKGIFYDCLYLVHKHYPPVVDHFLNRILFHFPNQLNQFKVRSLDMICSRLETIEDKWAETKNLGLERLISSKEPEEQTLALKIVSKMIHELTPEQTLDFVSRTPRVLQESVPEAREQAYELLIKVFNTCKSAQSGPGLDLKKIATSGLVEGLFDSEQYLQKRVLKFWLNNTVDRTKSLQERFVDWTRVLFSDETADLFVGSFTDLLLEELTTVPDFKRNVFEHQLEPCAFEDMQLLVSWRTQHATMQPLFVDSQASQAASQSLSYSAGYLQATQQQSLLFTPTQEEESDDEPMRPQFAISQSSLLFNLTPVKRQLSQKLNSITAEPEEPQFRTSFRFSANKKVNRSQFAKREVALRRRRGEVTRDLRQKQQGQVQMYRKYRIGDYPDIQIPFSAILKPLQVMTKQEPALAKTLWISLFLGLSEELKSTEEQHSHFLSNVETSLKWILQSLTGCVPFLVGAALEICSKGGMKLSPKDVKTVCSANCLAPLGCLLLESQIEDPEVGPPEPRRARLAVAEDGNKENWLKLAELYQTLEDRDSVLAIIKRAIGESDEDSKLVRAVEAEAVNNWQEAASNYKDFLARTTRDDLEYDFSLESHFKCLEKLSRWDEIGSEALRVSGSDEHFQLWDDQFSKENLLPWSLQSQVFDMLVLWQEDMQLVQHFKEWLNDPKKLPDLQKRFSEQTAVVCTANNDVEKSQFFSRLNLQILLSQWSVLSSFLPVLKAKKLAQLQCVAEVIAFNELSPEDSCYDLQRLEKLCEKWECNIPCHSDSMQMWERKIEYRSFFAESALHELNQTDWNDANLHKRLVQMRPKQELQLVDLALEQNNLGVASKFIKKTIRVKNDTDLGVQWSVTLGKVKWLIAQSKKEPEPRLADSAKAFKEMYSLTERPNLTMSQRASLEGGLADISWSIATQIGLNSSFRNSSHVTSILEILNADVNAFENVQHFFEDFGTRKAEASVESLEGSEDGVSQLLNALMRIVNHNRQLLTEEDISEEASTALTRGLIVSLLDAMKLGSKEARMLFPCLLQLDDVSKLYLELFIDKCREVPEWMFLGWLNQILAYIDTEKVTAVEPLLLRICTVYPNAVLLPFNFTTERIGSLTTNVRGTTKRLMKSLEEILAADSLTTKMMQNLCSVKQPEVVMRPHIMEINSCVRQGSVDRLKTAVRSLCLEIFQAETLANTGGSYAYSLVDDLAKQLMEALKPHLDGDFGSQSTMRSAAKLKQILDRLSAKVDNLKRHNDRVRLSDFSMWLANFQASHYGSEVEIPGQYTGDTIPNPRHHIKFSTFDNRVEVLPSMRMPIRIVCVGNNGRSYQYIVKAGEDLRQDERIQLLFSTMNNVFAEDQPCKDRQLKIKTYRVVPINTRCGLIEFVPNCSSLKEFTDSALSQDECTDITNVRSRFEYKQRQGVGQTAKVTVVFQDLYMHWPEAKTIKFFEDMRLSLPRVPLRRAFRQLSSSNEGYFWLRQNFVSSLAAMSIAHWLLGIGDRHRSNMLICRKTGVPVGIDFGHAFGSATQILPVPELMPFRLTGQLVDMMGPLKTSGTFRATMIHVLQALRKNHELLLHAMRVFIQEPSLDWQNNAIKLAKNFTNDQDAKTFDPTATFAVEKIHLATLKLQGAVPSLVMEEEVKRSVQKDDVKRLLKKLVRGNSSSLRDKLRSKALHETDDGQELTYQLTPAQQVDCLIEQATDKNILGKTFWGWEAWC